NDQTVGRAELPPSAAGADLVIDVAGAPHDLVAALTGPDAIADDDRAPVLEAGGALVIGIVSDPTTNRLATGGPPPAEQGLAALQADAQIRPIPIVPDQPDELATFGALLIDDPPGLTPECRRSIKPWLEHGGVALITLGRRAAAAPLGSTFEPIFS